MQSRVISGTSQLPQAPALQVEVPEPHSVTQGTVAGGTSHACQAPSMQLRFPTPHASSPRRPPPERLHTPASSRPRRLACRCRRDPYRAGRRIAARTGRARAPEARYAHRSSPRSVRTSATIRAPMRCLGPTRRDYLRAPRVRYRTRAPSRPFARTADRFRHETHRDA